jgi:hypothetical protein
MFPRPGTAASLFSFFFHKLNGAARGLPLNGECNDIY